MKEIILFTIIHFCLCAFFFFFIQKPLFILYNKSLNRVKMKPDNLRSIYSYGAVTDFIASSYLTAVPVLLLWVLSFFPGTDIYAWITGCNVLVALLGALVVVSDAALYKFWQFKIDSSVFAYLRSLKGAFASVSILYVVSALAVVVLAAGLLFVILHVATLVFRTYVPADVSGLGGHVLYSLLFLVVSACLFAVIRGIHHRPNNTSLAYHSNNPFYNHCALNPLYSLVYSLSVKDDFSGKFKAFDEDECKKEFELLFPTKGVTQTKLLNTTRPNILFIIWESLSARYIKTLGGEEGVMPRFEELAEEGVLFTRCDAGSFRTDRGLVCLLSGFLGQPTTSVIRHTRKLPNLPAFPRVLRDNGYTTMAVHGGNCQVMHKTDYYLATGHDTLVALKDLPASAPRCQWGINDDYMFSWLYDDIKEKHEQGVRWYTTFQTLSSHEPFDVPFHRLDDEKKNSFAYVDDSFGKFIDRMKKSPAWENLLVVCTGDHGFSYCSPISRDKFPHIPVLMLGGAVRQPMKIDKIIGQTDIAATLLGQLDLPHDDFRFSRDVLADTYTYPFSLHTYNNGFLFRDATGYTDFDNVADRATSGADARREHLGKVILQTLYDDLSKR